MLHSNINMPFHEDVTFYYKKFNLKINVHIIIYPYLHICRNTLLYHIKYCIYINILHPRPRSEKCIFYLKFLFLNNRIVFEFLFSEVKNYSR